MQYYIIFYIYYSISCTCKVCEFVSYIFNSIFIYFIIRMSSILKSSIQAFNARQIQPTHSFAYANLWGKIKNNSSYFPSRCIRQQANSSKMSTQWLYLSHALYGILPLKVTTCSPLTLESATVLSQLALAIKSPLGDTATAKTYSVWPVCTQVETCSCW